MSWLGSLFHRAPSPPPHAATVVIPDEIAAGLGGRDGSLQATVEEVLRSHIEGRRGAAGRDPDALPFWVRRDAGESGEIDQSLRDRVSERRAADSQG